MAILKDSRDCASFMTPFIARMIDSPGTTSYKQATLAGQVWSTYFRSIISTDVGAFA